MRPRRRRKKTKNFSPVMVHKSVGILNSRCWQPRAEEEIGRKVDTKRGLLSVISSSAEVPPPHQESKGQRAFSLCLINCPKRSLRKKEKSREKKTRKKKQKEENRLFAICLNALENPPPLQAMPQWRHSKPQVPPTMPKSSLPVQPLQRASRVGMSVITQPIESGFVR